MNRGLLPAEGQIMMAQVETSIIDLVDSVESGSITVEKLEMLEKHSKEFLALAAVVEKSKVRSSSADQSSCVTAVLRDRCGELQAFHKDKKLLKSFISFCDTLRSG